MDAVRAFIAALALLAATPAAADPVERWRPHIAEASVRFGVPADWIERVMRAESGGHTHLHGRPITSSAGAMGLMQLMPGTWADMRASLKLGSNPHDPRDNVLAGTAYLRLMHDRFGYPGLFAAYHAGPARYARYLRGQSALPRETRAYLRQVAGAALPPLRTPAPLPRTPVASAERPQNGIFFGLENVPQVDAEQQEDASDSSLFVPLRGDE